MDAPNPSGGDEMSDVSVYENSPMYAGFLLFLGMTLGAYLSIGIVFMLPTYLIIVLLVFVVIGLAIASRTENPNLVSVVVLGVGILVSMLLCRLIAENVGIV